MYISLPSAPPGSMTRSVTVVVFMKSLNSRTKSAPMTTAATIERIGPVPVPSVNSRGTCGRTAHARLSLPKPALSKRSPEQAEGCAPCGSSRSC